MALAVLEQAPSHLATTLFNVGDVSLHTLMVHLTFDLQLKLLLSRVYNPSSSKSSLTEPRSLHLHHATMLPAFRAAIESGYLTALETLHLSLRADDLHQVLLLLPLLKALNTLRVQPSLSELEPTGHFRSVLGVLAVHVPSLRHLTALELHNHGHDTDAEALVLASEFKKHHLKIRSFSLQSCWWSGHVVGALVSALTAQLQSLHLEQAQMLDAFPDDSVYWNHSGPAVIALALCKCTSLQSLVIRWEPWLILRVYSMLKASQHHAASLVLPTLQTSCLQFTNTDWPCHKSLLRSSTWLEVPKFALSLQHLRLPSMATDSARRLCDILETLADLDRLRSLAIAIPELGCQSRANVAALFKNFCSLADLEMTAQGHSVLLPSVSSVPLERLVATRAAGLDMPVTSALFESHDSLPLSLKHLHISSCCTEGVQKGTAIHGWMATLDFCTHLGHLTHLTHLELHGARLDCDPVLTSSPQSNTPLCTTLSSPASIALVPATIPALIGSLKSLSRLDFLDISGSCSLTWIVAKALSTGSFTALRQLGIRCPGNIYHLHETSLCVGGLMRLSQLRSLCLSRGVLRQWGIALIVGALACMRDLEELRAPGCHLLGGGEEFVHYLSSATALRRLDLSGADLQHGLNVLSKGLASPQCFVQELLLADSVGVVEAVSGCGEFTSCVAPSTELLWLLASSPLLHHVDLSRCGVPEDALEVVLRSLHEAHPVVQFNVHCSNGPCEFLNKPCDVFMLRIASGSTEQQQEMEKRVEDLQASVGRVAFTRSVGSQEHSSSDLDDVDDIPW
jgi:hypothetical protein